MMIVFVQRPLFTRSAAMFQEMPGKGKSDKSKTKKKERFHQSTDQEIILQAELERKVRDLAEIKLRLHSTQEENKWLNEEANRIRIETTEYGQYMSKKANLRRQKIVTLSDYHREEIKDLRRQTELMLERYQQKKQDSRLQLVRKEQLLKDIKVELQKMEGYEAIREHQQKEIERLHEEIARIRAEHVHGIAQMKSTFEKEIEQQRIDDDAKVEQTRQQGDQEAARYLYQQTLKIQDESVELRTTLHDLLRRIELLKGVKQRHEEEQLHLINRLKLAADLKRIRSNHTDI